MKNKIVKTHTDLSQSKKLAEILPIESADLDYIPVVNSEREYSLIFNVWNNEHESSWIPCWSLSALLGVLPTVNGKQPILTRGNLTSLWYCYYEDEIDTQTYDNPVDACYEMILKLHEQKLL